MYLFSISELECFVISSEYVLQITGKLRDYDIIILYDNVRYIEIES